MILKRSISSNSLILLCAGFLVLFCNLSFFEGVLDVFPLSVANAAHIVSLALLSGALIVLLLGLICIGRLTRIVLALVLCLSALAAYHMDTYHIVIDVTMIDNILQTNTAEAADLLSLKLILYFALLGLLPAWWVMKAPLSTQGFKKAFLHRSLLLGGATLMIVVNILAFGNFYASFFREHKPLRYYANPSYYLYSSGKYISQQFASEALPFREMGHDAHVPAVDTDRELIILVLGETARADHFSINGYPRQTNPELTKQDIISFSHVSSCGTSTAVSVPCMFSLLTTEAYDKDTASSQDNILDIMQLAGVNILWLDNNSDSKGVAVRVPYEDYRSPDNNPICDEECRDIGMLTHLQRYIDEHPQGDIFIILHQMGNHGPAYYKRYPPEFERFTPVCKTSQLEACSVEEVTNAYDNAILYTDYFLSSVIELLKTNSGTFEAAMFYISDHGESLGENNLYLHGLPKLIAPEEQTHVPMVLWFSEHFDRDEIDIEKLRGIRENAVSHDHLAHTILGLFEIESGIYEPDLDLIDHTEYE